MDALFLILGSFALLYLILVFLVSPASKAHPDLEKIKGKYIAHRGLHDENIPENSIRAFLAATKENYPIEIDLHLIHDGSVVVFHDETLKRMCGVNKKIADTSLSELKELRLLQTNETIPTLQECLRAVDGKVPLLIEFKVENGNAMALCQATDKILSEYQGDYLIQSFYPQVVRWYKKHRKNICRGQLACHFRNEGFAKWLCGNLLINFLGRPHFVSYRHSDSCSPMLKFAVWLGAIPIGWTFRTKNELRANGSFFKAWIFENFIPHQ